MLYSPKNIEMILKRTVFKFIYKMAPLGIKFHFILPSRQATHTKIEKCYVLWHHFKSCVECLIYIFVNK